MCFPAGITNGSRLQIESKSKQAEEGKQPELWQAEDLSIIDAPVWQAKNGLTSVSHPGITLLFTSMNPACTPGLRDVLQTGSTAP